MSPSKAMENDKKRLRNQFTKDERIRLLGIMAEYGPLLDDKNISILSRKEIWEIIENKFNEAGHSGRTSAQLKKYWQNYKYHNKRTKVIQKDNPKPMSPTTKQVIRMMAKVDPDEWAQYNVIANLVPAKISPKTPETPTMPMVPYELCAPLSSGTMEPLNAGTPRNVEECEEQDSPTMLTILTTPPLKILQSSTSKATPTSLDDSGAASTTFSSDAGCEVKESNVVISTTDVSGSSVMVSVMCPEIPPKAKTILWKKKKPSSETVNEKMPFGDTERNKTATRKPLCKNDFCTDPKALKEISSLEKLRKNVSRKKPNATGLETSAVPNECHSIFIDNNYGLTIAPNRVRKSPINKSRAQIGNGADSVENGQCFLLPSQKEEAQFMDASDTVIDKHQTDFIGNVIGIIRQVSGPSRSKTCDTMGMEAKANSSKESENNAGPSQSLAKSSTNSVDKIEGKRSTSKDNTKDEVDPGLNKFLLQFASLEGSKRKELLKKVEQLMKPFTSKKESFKEDWLETLAAPMDNDQRMELIKYLNLRDRILAADPTRKDLVTMKYLLKPLLNAKEFEKKRYMETIRRLLPSLCDKVKNQEGGAIEENLRCRKLIDYDHRMDVDDEGPSDNGNPITENELFRLKMRNVSLATADNSNDKENVNSEIKVEKEDAETDTMRSTPDLRPESGAMVNFMVQAKVQSAKAELEHQMELQRLEMDERRLKVKIAEMSIQETRLRIQSLNEERLRAKELHELRLAQMTAEKVRAETEYMVRMDASQIVADEGRARINNVERDRERSENLYQMQLRCMGINSSNTFNAGNGQYH